MRVLTSLLIATALSLTLVTPIPAQVQPPASSAPASTAKTFSQQELDQLLAPIALYPDSLLAQILMASTYPLDIILAERWVKANPSVKDKALQDALQQQPWDPSVKSLTVFPQVLTMMSEKLDWTQKLGDAFLAQQQDLMASVQALRGKAVSQGSLKDSDQQKVITEVQNNTTIIKIEPTNPEIVYVPTYNPAVVYGTWPYPTYPPYYWYPPSYYYPPGYAWGGALLGFTAGVIIGGALWGGITWGGGGDININSNRYNNFNRTNISDGKWKHNSDRRGSVPYRDKGVAQQYGRGRAGDAASREAFRGRSEAGRQAVQRGDFSSRDFGGRDAASGRDFSGRTSSGSRDLGGRTGASGRDFGAGDRSGMRQPTAFDTGRGAQTRDFSNRGSASRSSARSSGSFGGGARGGGGGGGGRGGGGGGGRGGGRR
jgi:hypothetical protein